MRRIAPVLAGALALALTFTGLAHADVAPAGSTSATATSTSVSLPAVSVSGANRLLAVGISTVDSVTVTDVTFGGEALTRRVAHAEYGSRSEIWTLTAPATGSGSVQVTLSGAASATVGATLFTGVHQGAPVIAVNAASADTGATSASAQLNDTATADGMFGVLALGNVANTFNVRTGGSIDTVTADVRWNEVGAVRGAGATRSGNTGQNMALNAGVSWRWNRIDPAQKNPYALTILGLRSAPVNQPPSASAGGPYSVSQGNAVTLDASGSHDPEGAPLTYAWDIDGDDAFDDATGASPTLSWDQLDGRTSATVRVRVSDGDTTATSAPATIAIANVAPTAVLTHSGDVAEGGTATVSFTGASDPSQADAAALRYAFDLDGKVFVGGPSYGLAASSDTVTVPAALLANGPRTLKITGAVFDRNGGMRLYATTLEVTNAAPAATLSGDTVAEGEPATVRFSEQRDASTADAEAGFTYEYDLDGDGTFEPGGASATLPARGPGEVKVRAAILDRDGARSEYETTVTVTNAAPTASISGPVVVPASGQVTLEVAGKDAAPGDLTGTLDWGDGTKEPFAGSGPRSHTYAAAGDYTVTLVVHDAHGGESVPARHTLSVAALPAPKPNDPVPTPEPESTPAPTAPAAPQGGVLGVTAKPDARISGLQVTPRCIRAPGLRAVAAAKRTVTVRFRLNADAPVRFDLKRWKGKSGAASCPPVRGRKQADGRRIPGVYSAHSERALQARAGVNTVTLAATGSDGKRLKPGTYLLTVTSGDAKVRTKVWVLAP